jgi:hypothetical protein
VHLSLPCSQDGLDMMLAEVRSLMVDSARQKKFRGRLERAILREIWRYGGTNPWGSKKACAGQSPCLYL